MVVPLALLCLLAPPDAPTIPALKLRELTPAGSDAPLLNPGMGVYLFGTRNPADMPANAWFSPIVTIGYFRDDWAMLQPDGPTTAAFDAYFQPIFDLWVKQWGKRLSFRFMSQNMHSKRQYVTPKWVFDQGVPSVKHTNLYNGEQVNPVFWDDRYLAIQEKFIAQLGQYLDGKPGVEFIDIGGIGEWGEMHLARWTPQQLAESGYSDTKYVGAYRRMIDAYARAFPRTRVFLNVGDWDQINDYAAIRGVHFRQDGLHPAGPSANVGKRFYVPYARRGVSCNYELHSGYAEMKQKGWGLRETFTKGLEDPISYFHINLMGYRQLLDAPAEVKEVVTDLGRRLGFRFALTKLRLNATVGVDPQRRGRLLLEQTWRNLGVAPCYDSYALRWQLTDAGGQVVAERVSFPRRATTQWWPGDEVTLQDVLAIPPGTAPGDYRLSVAMVKPEQPDLRIQLALAGRTAGGAYDLGAVPLRPSVSAQGLVYQEGFETGVAGWTGTGGVTLKPAGEGHSGQACLSIGGTSPGPAWNYASITLPQRLQPLSLYRLSCWLRVDRCTSKHAPYLKIGLARADGKWITNANTGAYDLSKLGTWQYLETQVETTPETAGGHLAVERGQFEGAVTIDLRLDDLKLELVEAP